MPDKSSYVRSLAYNGEILMEGGHLGAVMQGVASGWAKGMKLQAPKTGLTRPTAVKVRQAVLNALQNWVVDARVLDLYAGSGAIGIEFLSRGAASCVFVENEREALRCLEGNVRELQRRAAQAETVCQATVLRCSVRDAGPSVVKVAPFDVIWADAPYDVVAAEALHWARAWRLWLAPAGVAVIECRQADRDAVIKAFADAGWDCYRDRSYGQTTVTIWQRAHADQA